MNKPFFTLCFFLFFRSLPLVAQTTDVVTGLSSPRGLAFHGNELYIAEFGANRISKIDLSDPNPAATEVVSISDHPRGLAVRGNELYIAIGNKISKFDLSTLSVDQAVPTKAFSLYPNPTSGIIEISGLTKSEPYKIYNLLGAEMFSGATPPHQGKIDVKQLKKGCISCG